MKYSRQREMILEAVASSRMHPTADEVYTALKQDNPSLSLGTVYRNLNLLAQTGKIRKIALAGTGDRFDGNVMHHDHMICSKCGKVYDINLALLEELPDRVFNATGFQVEDYDFVIYGLCVSCAEEN